MAGDRPKFTRTTRYVSGRTPSRGFDGTRPVPGWVLRHPTFVPRLNWKARAKVDYDFSKLCESIEQAPEDVSFFCDTSIFDVRTDDRLWSALLNRPGKLVITPRVRIELEPWLKNHPDNIVSRAVLDRDNGIRFLRYSDSQEQLDAYLYYTNLLGARKQLLRLRRIEFEHVHGRLPSEQDDRVLWEDIQR